MSTLARSSHFTALLALLLTNAGAVGGGEPPAARIKGLRACYASPQPIRFEVSNDAQAELAVNVAIEMNYSGEWRDAVPSLTGATSGKLIKRILLGPGKTLSLSFDPWERPMVQPAPELFAVRIDVFDSEGKVDIVRSNPFRVVALGATCAATRQ